MNGAAVFCERCGTPQPRLETSTPRSAGAFARRVLDAVGVTETQAEPTEDWLRLCFNCRGYACPTCWNDDQGVCQTCAPLPQPAIADVVAEMPEAAPEAPDAPPPFAAIYVPEPIVYPPAPEPALAAPPQPEPFADAEPEAAPEPLVVAEPEPVTRPAPPRMPVLPLPPPRPADAPVLPLPPLPPLAPPPGYSVPPQIAFSAQGSAETAAARAAPVYQPHALLAPPPEEPHGGPGGLRPCANCRLTLSARAVFCRRCGAAQPN